VHPKAEPAALGAALVPATVVEQTGRDVTAALRRYADRHVMDGIAQTSLGGPCG
jgi:uncharacterized protein YbbK (DUF523 family)